MAEKHDRTLCRECLTPDYDSFRHTCVHESVAKNEAWVSSFGIDRWPRWEYSMEDAMLVFSSDNKPKVICDMQVVGTTHNESWQWSWGNDNLPMACRWRMSEVRDFGQHKQWEQLTTLFLKNDKYLGWECGAVANHLLQGVGVYRGPNSDVNGAVWMVVLSARFVQ